jgi:hypothetical protein
MKMERKVRSFKAQRPNGQVVMIDEYQEFIETTSKGNQREWLPGLKRLVLQGGGAVNFVDDKTFTVVSTGETLTIP